MSHIFISYCHLDLDSLEILRQTLRDNDLHNEMWYDKDIEAGYQWIPQIDVALDEAYALIVIVTPASMNSRYVTYEWSSMLGSNTPIFPLLFKGNYDDMHPRLLLEQLVDCRKGIPDYLIDTLKSKRSTPPEISFLNRNISNMLLRFRIAAQITLWYYGHIEEPVDKIRFSGLVDGMLHEAGMIFTQKLPDLIVSRSHAFTKKQLRMSRDLLKGLETFWETFETQIEGSVYRTNSPDSFANAAPKAIEFWGSDLKPLIDFFRTKHHHEEAFDTLVNLLDAIERGDTSMEGHFFLDPLTIINWMFDKDDEYAGLLRESIQNAVDRLRAEKK